METTSDTGINIEETASTIATDLFGSKEAKEEVEEAAPADNVEQVEQVDQVEQPEAELQPPETPPESVRPAPKSWAKDYHEFWPKLDPKVQEYIELREKQMLDGLSQYKDDAQRAKKYNEVFTPYKALLQSQGIDEYTAVQYLLNAHYQLTNGTAEERMSAYKRLGESLGFQEPAQIDPTIKSLQDQIRSLEGAINAGQRKAFEETQMKVSKEVEVFASDPKHPYFDEVADDIVAMIKAGKSLEDAYEKAVWANPVTREKEIARIQTENEAKLKEKAKQEAEAARKASSANVKSRDTKKAPTGPKGTMEDTMKETLRSIKERAH